MAVSGGKEEVPSLRTKEGLLIADSARGPVRLGMPVQAVAYIFPGLFSEDSTSGTVH